MKNHRFIAGALLAAMVGLTGCDAFMDDRRSSSRDRSRDRRSGDWTLLGQRSIDFTRERESVDVDSDRRFHELLVAVKGAPVEVSNLVVTFGDGTTYSPQLRSVFQEGTESRAIDLPGDARRIDRIDLASRSTSKREGKATILLYGR